MVLGHAWQGDTLIGAFARLTRAGTRIAFRARTSPGGRSSPVQKSLHLEPPKKWNRESGVGFRTPGRSCSALRGGGSAVGSQEFRDQSDLALGVIFRNLRHFLLSRRFQELTSCGVSSSPDLREEIAVAIAVKDHF
jgi:hypothetical protein